ncbi:50S ribosomal protein L31 [Candidatus Parcubacteria bacterium]|nr:50S ribosomal protein L31 [Patescibacteria group bacterium]MCG2694334.1 50S ribosomal protein L31 [Candidatus Parcubacteria bacterium]
MKKDIHPTYHKDAKITCACGMGFVIGSTEPEIKTELCSSCHPFYTGKQKIVDTARRVEKFQEKMAKKESVGKDRKGKAVKRKAQVKRRAEKVKKVKTEETGK